MKRLIINVSSGLAMFAVGVAASSFLNWINRPVIRDQPTVIWDHRVPNVSDPLPEATPEVVSAGGRLRIVPAEVAMTNERLRYKIHVVYPQILDSKDLHIRELNRRLVQLATEQYQWPLSPSKADLKYYREKWPDVFNSVYLDYEIRTATDSLLSIYFIGTSYGIGAAHPVEYSFAVNYDLHLQKELKLSDLFTPRSKYLEFISQYCVNELTKQSVYMFDGALSPKPANFESWNITRDGIRFNFDECTVSACAEGDKTVEIPFADLKEFLNGRMLEKLSSQLDEVSTATR